MKTPHKHAAFIRAWADGVEIEFFTLRGWIAASSPSWGIDYEYRIKPEPKPDVVESYYVTQSFCVTDCSNPHNLKLTFDGETGKLKAAEVIE